jgi:hypothetical protein
MNLTTVSSGTYKIVLSNNDNRNQFSLVRGDTVEKIQEVAADFPYEMLSFSRLSACLNQMHMRVVVLSDGVHKLYLQPRLMGGMLPQEDSDRASDMGIFDPNIPDKAVAVGISRAMPPHLYSSISVFRMTYNFMGKGEMDSRVVVLTPQGWRWFANIVRSIFQKREGLIPVGNQVISAILGSKDEDDVKALKESFCRNQIVTVAFSMDQSRVNVAFEDSPVTTFASSSAEKVSTVVDEVALQVRKYRAAVAEKCTVS